MSQNARENPDSEENQQQTRNNECYIGGLKLEAAAKSSQDQADEQALDFFAHTCTVEGIDPKQQDWYLPMRLAWFAALQYARENP